MTDCSGNCLLFLNSLGKVRQRHIIHLARLCLAQDVCFDNVRIVKSVYYHRTCFEFFVWPLCQQINMTLTKSRRTKRILRCLYTAQQYDQMLSPSATPLIRYNLLHNYHRCIQVTVDLGKPFGQSSHVFALDELSWFLRSQLEAQRITNETRLWSQVAPILTFIEANIRILGKPHKFPTLFIWQSREHHRSFLFFAFVDVKMVSKTYTARELLRLRQVSLSKGLYNKLYERLHNDGALGMCKLFCGIFLA